MFKKFYMLMMALMMIIGMSAYAETQEEMEAQCKQWAQEDKISEDELKDYIEECIISIKDQAAQENESK